MTDLTFTIQYANSAGVFWGGELDATLEDATKALASSKLHEFIVEIAPDRDIVQSDFASYEARCALAELGYFSVDMPEHRAKRTYQRGVRDYIEEAYMVLGFDRKEAHRALAAKVTPPPAGVWLHSWGPYGEACAALDAEMLNASPAIIQSIRDLAAECGQPQGRA